MPNRTRRERGFTIIELLIVIGIIAILISFLMPIIGSLRTRASAVNCANNERHIYTAMLGFAADHDGYLPVPAQVSDTASGNGKYCAWAIDNNYGNTGGVLDFKVGTLWQYLASTVSERQGAVICPADAGAPSSHSGLQFNRNFSYSFNANLGHPVPDIVSMKLRDVKVPVSKILIYEEEAPNDEWGLGGSKADDWPAGRHGTARATVGAGGPTNQLWLVEGLGNHCFFDGHVDLISPKAIYTDVQKSNSMWYPLR
jgi:prepilin-type N-terminal cleavage/methylation domain-containing protein